MGRSFRRAIARIEVGTPQTGQRFGTAFLVHGNYVLTALHCVADRGVDPPQFMSGPIMLRFPDRVTQAAVVSDCWDRSKDFVLLKCDQPPDEEALHLAELNESEGQETGSAVRWQTHGWPSTNPVDPMDFAGEVRTAIGRVGGVEAIQLFSFEAAAGVGAQVPGLSGAPVIVNGAVVGLLRSALTDAEGKSQAGALYACPVSQILLKCAGFLPMPDPVWGLPGLPRWDLPSEPFRYLSPYRKEEAELFFGRNDAVRRLYDTVMDPDTDPIILFYGQSGVGKSSLLDAGLQPRLEWNRLVRYARRDPEKRLSGSLAALLGRQDMDAELPDPRLALETEKPLIVMIDQVEKALEPGVAEDPSEWPVFARKVVGIFADRDRRPRGKILLSFRKEWLAEIEKTIEEAGGSFTKIMLRPMGREDVRAVVAALAEYGRFQRKYHIQVEPGLPELIADDLTEDPNSPIAPTLQVLLTKMWQQAKRESSSEPRFTKELYSTLKQKGDLLRDFLHEQLSRLPPAHVQSGLALDVLSYHTTDLGTGTRHVPASELSLNYSHVTDFTFFIGAV
ncbi:MAG: serine protease, partial [Pseudomonadota bacterium]